MMHHNKNQQLMQYYGQSADAIDASDYADLICMTRLPLHPQVANIVLKHQTGKQQFSAGTMLHAFRIQLQYESMMQLDERQ